MNRIFTIAATLTLALILGASALHAGSLHVRETDTLTFRVTGDFSIGDQTLPAGPYSLKRVSGTMFRIESPDKYWGFVNATFEHSGDFEEAGAVITNDGQGYFLSAFTLSGSSGAWILPAPNRQTE